MSIRHTLICNGNPWIALCKRILSQCILSLHLQVYVKAWKEKINQYDNTTNSRLWLQKNGLPAVQTCKPTETFGTSWNEKNATKKAEICWAAESSISPESEHFLLSKTAAIVLFSVYRQLKEKMMQYSGKYIMYQFFFRCGVVEIQMYHFQHLAICLCSTFNETLD